MGKAAELVKRILNENEELDTLPPSISDVLEEVYNSVKAAEDKLTKRSGSESLTTDEYIEDEAERETLNFALSTLDGIANNLREAIDELE